MSLIQSLNKKTMIAMMIGVAGLTASIASAQFKVEYSAKAESAPESKKTHTIENTVTISTSKEGEHTYEIKIVNGNITVAKIDGRVIDNDQIKHEGDVWIFIGEDGDALHEFRLPSAPAVVDGVFPRKQVKVKFADQSLITNGENKFRVQFAGEPDEKGYFSIQGTVIQPKVMLGINLGEPSIILRKHLNLKDGISAILVERVIKGLPAEAAGLQEFDVIVSIEGSDQASSEILGKILTEKDAGDTMKLIVLRSGEQLKIKIKLAEYNAQKLGGTIYYDDMEGYEEIKEKLEATEKNAKNIELELLTKFENGEFGHIQSDHLAELKVQLHNHLTKAADQHNITIDLRAKAMDAMKQAERQMVEFQDGRLFVRTPEWIAGRVRGRNLNNQFPEINTDAIHEHMNSIKVRVEQLESRLDHQIGEMSEQMDRLMSMFERLMDRLENNDD